MSELWAVTGASGYIGQALLRALDADGIPTRTLSRRPLERANHIAADLREPAALRELVRGASLVVHLGAFVHRSARSANARRECFAVNVGATRSLVEAIATEPSAPFLIFVSSANVYAPSPGAIGESAALVPQSPYGEAKLEGERIVLGSPVAATVLRPAVVFGPGAPGNLAKLAEAVKRWPHVVPRVTAVKSIVPIETLIEAIRDVATRRPAGEVFNVAGKALRMDDIVAQLAAGLGVKVWQVPLPLRWLAPFSRLVRTYTTNAILDGEKLGLEPTDVREAVRASVER